jgi:hypothetical protein
MRNQENFAGLAFARLRLRLVKGAVFRGVGRPGPVAGAEISNGHARAIFVFI